MDQEKSTVEMDKEKSEREPGRLIETAARRSELAGPSGVAGLIKNPRLLTIALCTALGTFCYGYEQGAYSQVLVMSSFVNNPSFSRIASDSSYKGWSVSTLGLGGWLGALSNGYCCDKFSRRWMLFAGGIMCLLGTGLTTGARDPVWIFVGRFFIGVAVGSLSASVPLYNSEISLPELRGSVVSMQQLAIVTGICVSFWVGYGTNNISNINSASWRVCLAGQGVPALALCCLCFWIPYTPRWLVQQHRFEEALKTLAHLRERDTDDELVQLEFMEIRAQALFEEETTAELFPEYVGGKHDFLLELARFKSLFTTRSMFHRTSVACLIQFFQQMSGIDCIVYYAPTIFASLGLPGKTVTLLAGVIGIVFVIATIPAIFLIDKVGRRPLLIWGGVGMAICLVIVATIIAKFQHSWETHQSAAWTAASFIWIYIACFAASWGPCSWTVISEVFPLSARSYGVALGASTNWIINFAVSIIVPIMLERISYGTYLFFLGFMLLGIGYVMWLVPETFGKSLEEMDLVFGSSEGARDILRLEEIYGRLGLSDTTKS